MEAPRSMNQSKRKFNDALGEDHEEIKMRKKMKLNEEEEKQDEK